MPLKPHATGRNIVGQQLPTLLDVTCCIRLDTLLHVVAQSLKPDKILAPYKRMQDCWELLGPFVRSLKLTNKFIPQGGREGNVNE